jgi:N6-L-threonylcarbamoyladenine synthase
VRVLGIETSCDETGVAVVDTRRGLLAHALYSQVALHAEFGGVVPELASRDHVRKLLPLVKQVLADAGTEPGELDGVAYTAGPGLIGALLVGACVGRSLAWAWGVPAVGVHHMEGHLLAPMLESRRRSSRSSPCSCPAGTACWSRSAGWGATACWARPSTTPPGRPSTRPPRCSGWATRGPALARLAEQGRPGRLRLPRPMLNRPGLDFSFSGLKTAVITGIRASSSTNKRRRTSPGSSRRPSSTRWSARACARSRRRASARLVVAGGVGANRRLRAAARRGGQASRRAEVYYPRLEFCTDNGAMIAYAGMLRLAAGESRRVVHRGTGPVGSREPAPALGRRATTGPAPAN